MFDSKKNEWYIGSKMHISTKEEISKPINLDGLDGLFSFKKKKIGKLKFKKIDNSK